MPDESPELGLSEDGEKAMDHFEGNVLHVYKDQAGLATIGRGHLCRAEELYTGRFPGGVQAYRDSQGRWAITAPQSSIIFRYDLSRFEKDLTRLYKGPRPLTQNEIDAILLWDFNTGGLLGSGVLSALNEGRYGDVPGQMMRWNHIRDRRTGALIEDPGLSARRKAEVSIWLNGYAHPETDELFRRAAAEAYARNFNLQDTLESGHVTLRDEDPPPDTERNT